jgi:AcrR family transcriptional regulator
VAASPAHGTALRTRGGYAAGHAARERILEAATTAFGEHGYRGASLASIGRSIGMTQQGVLYHFPTKVALLLAILEERDRQGQSTWPRDRGFVGTEVLDAWDATVADNVERYGLVRLAHVLGAEATDEAHPARDHFIQHFDIGRSMLRQGFRAGVESGELRDDLDYELVIRQVLAMSEGLENQWLIDPGGVDIVACFHDYTRTLRDHLRRNP